MRIVLLGNFSATFCSEAHWSATLQDMGVEVIEAQEDATSPDQLRAACEGADVLWWTKTPNFLKFSDEVMIALLKELEGRGIVTITVHLDLFVPLPRGTDKALLSSAFWRTQHVFTPDGSPQAAETFKRLGIDHHYLRAGVFKPECYLAVPDPRFACDVTFVGSEQYHSGWAYRRKLIDWLRRTYGSRFKKHGPPQDCVRGHDLNVLYASAKVVVGDTFSPGFSYPRYFSDRIYETMGRGGMLVWPFIEGIYDEFENGKHLVQYNFGDFGQLKALIDHYIANDAERERIRLAGHLKVKSACTYHARMRELLTKLAELEPSLREKIGDVLG